MPASSADARQLAEELLANALPQRWAHTQGVAHQARFLAPVLGPLASTVEQAAWLHDIGYSPALVKTGFHPLDGARFLRDHTDIGSPVAVLVAHHSGASVEAANRGLLEELSSEFPDDAFDDFALAGLTYSDMVVGPGGEPMSVDERLAEILRRYPPDDVVHRSIEQSSEAIRGQCARVAARLRRS